MSSGIPLSRSLQKKLGTDLTCHYTKYGTTVFLSKGLGKSFIYSTIMNKKKLPSWSSQHSEEKRY